MIATTLGSVVAQDVSDLQILVIDDQSTEPVVEAASKFVDERLTVIVNERNLGLFGNFNRCVALAASPLVRILCNDDQLTENCLSPEISFMEAHPNVVLLLSRAELVTPSGASRGLVGDHLPAGIYDGSDAIAAIISFFAHTGINPVTLPSGVLMRKSACEAIGWFDESSLVLGDVDYFLRLLEHGDLGVLDAVGCRILSHEDQVSSQHDGNTAVMREHFDLAFRHETLLSSRGMMRRVVDQLAAFTVLRGVYLLLHGRGEEARAHFALARTYRIPAARMVVASVRCLVQRFQLKHFGIRQITARPVSAL